MAKKRPARASTPVEREPARVVSEKGRGSGITTWDIGAAFTLLCLTVLVYLPALNGSLIWDDVGHVTRPELQSLHGLWRIWFDVGATQQYYPLLHTAFWLEHQLWGDAVVGYHLLNIALHAASACLVVAIMRRLRLPGAWLAGFIFAVHPVCAEAVAWISEQKSTLSTVFYLLALLTYLQFDEGRRRNQYLFASVLFGCALMSKTVTATLPAALLVIVWAKRGNLGLRRDVAPLAPWLALGVTGGLFTAWVERTYIGAHGSDFTLTFIQRILLAGRAIWFYLGKLAWPNSLIFVYPHWTIDAGSGWQYLFPMGVIAAAYALWILARRWRLPLAGFLFFIGTLFPVLGFFNVYPFIYSYVADHFQYLASLGIIIPLASGLALAAKRLPATSLKPAVATGCVLIIGTLSLLTRAQSAMYQNSEVLFRTTLERHPGAWMAHTNLGILLAQSPDRKGEAITHFEAAIKEKPDLASAHFNLASALSETPERIPEATNEYETALRIDPDSVETRGKLGLLLMKTPGRLPEAVALYRDGLQKTPDNAMLHYYLANALSASPGQMPEAIAEYRKALQIDPQLTNARYDLANALLKSPEHAADAISEYRDTLNTKPDDAETHLNLGYALLEKPGHEKEAVTEFQAAIRIRPHYAEAHYNLGLLLSDMPGHANEAIAEYRAALRDKPDYPEAHSNLGVALSDVPGKSGEAIAEFEAALRGNPNLAEAHFGLAQVLATMPGRTSEAISHLEEVVRLKPDYEPAREALAALRTPRSSKKPR